MAPLAVVHADDDLVFYPAVPGFAASEHSKCVRAAAEGGEPQLLWGHSDARIRNLTFQNLTLAGKPVHGSEFSKANGFVDGLMSKP